MVGRIAEQNILKKLSQGSDSEFVAVIGRRRVGKTYLIEEYFKSDISFQISGHKDFTNQEHLKDFANKLKEKFRGVKWKEKHTNWINLFKNLIQSLESKPIVSGKKHIVFIDELPWLCKQKSGFIAALGFFWSDWARSNRIILIVCGSAAAWMIENIVKEKGSLYNRMTKLIRLKPFHLSEAKAYLESKQIYFNNDQLMQLYMVMGGIPHYLKEVEGGISAVQNIQNICFSPNGLLANEYGNLYDAIFNNSKDYKKIIEVLFNKKRGMTKLEIAAASKLTPNGAFYDKIEELLECDFIMEVSSFEQKSKSSLYRLIDEYSLFYHYFIKKQKVKTEDYWYSLTNTPVYHNWTGYAFENICYRHVHKIIETLKIAGVKINIGGFYHKANEDVVGAQIDMLIDRADQCINLVECKYYKDHFYLSAAEANNLKRRKAAFVHLTKTKKQIFITLICPGELIYSKESLGLIDQAMSAEVLF
jgi:uncharacterized protein